MTRLLMGLTAAVLLAVGSAAAHDAKQGTVRVGHAWAKPADDGPARAFMPVLNEGGTGRTLVGASSPGATAALVGKDGEVVDTIAVPAGKMVNLAAWREHIRLTGFDGALEQGERVPLTLRFADGTTLDLSVIVETEPGH